MNPLRGIVIDPSPGPGFVDSPAVQALARRALRYLRAGSAVNLTGPTGCGKTTLALHLAHLLGRPAVMLNGHADLSPSILLGAGEGYRRRALVDNFIQRVHKSVEEVEPLGADSRLVTACREGYTLIYNEFTRARPEANTPLLSVLTEGLLEAPGPSGTAYVAVHPEFRAIFTSNPEEYEGVFRCQDALLDRMVPVNLGAYDEATELAIALARAPDTPPDLAEAVVRCVRSLRGLHLGLNPTTRAIVTLCRVLALDKPDAREMGEICRDTLSPRATKREPRVEHLIDAAVDHAGLLAFALHGETQDHGPPASAPPPPTPAEALAMVEVG